MINPADKKRQLRTIRQKQILMGISIVFFGFTMLCAASTIYFDRDVGEPLTRQFDENGGMLGPIEVPEDNTVYEFTAIRAVPYGGWSYVGIELLNDEGEYLMGFGDEFWAEQGYDSDGHWSESYNRYYTNIVIPSEGVHFVKVNVENPKRLASSSPLYVSIQQQAGGTFLLTLCTFLGLVAALFFAFVNSSIKVI